MLLLCALVAGSGSVWADSDIESNFTNKDAAVGTDELQWTATNTNSFETSGNARGVQSSKNTTPMVFTSNAVQTVALGTIKKVVVTASANADRPISITVGGRTFGTAQTVLNGTSNANTDYTFSGSGFGQIVVSIAEASKSSSCWIKKIVVTYDNSQVAIAPTTSYSTLTCGLALNFTGIDGLKAYIATEISGGSVQMTQVNKVPAGTGLVLHKTSGTTFNVPVFDGTGADEVTSNKMAGSATATTAIAANGGYILKDGVFQPATAGTLAAGKAYLNIEVTSAHPLEMSFDNGDVTSIERLDAATPHVDGQYYNLAGQRVAQPTKGLYIVNGKKVIVK